MAFSWPGMWAEEALQAALVKGSREGARPEWASGLWALRLASGICILPLQLCQAIRVLIAPPSAA